VNFEQMVQMVDATGLDLVKTLTVDLVCDLVNRTLIRPAQSNSYTNTRSELHIITCSYSK